MAHIPLLSATLLRAFTPDIPPNNIAQTTEQNRKHAIFALFYGTIHGLIAQTTDFIARITDNGVFWREKGVFPSLNQGFVFHGSFLTCFPCVYRMV